MNQNVTGSLPSYTYDDGSRFVAEQRIPSTMPAFQGLDADELRAFVAHYWQQAWEGKRAETERLKLCSLYYDGFHYQNAWLNRSNPIANYCFSTVETVVPIITEVVPRPEIMPRRSMDAATTTNIQETAQWLMDTAAWDDAEVLATRDKCIYGWCVRLLSFDYRTGMPYPKNLSVFHFYPDPTARTPEEWEYAFIAMPVSTENLRATFPAVAHLIEPDGLAGPDYDVQVRPFYEFLENAYRYETPYMISGALSFVKESDPAPNTSTSLVASPGGYREHGDTTFLLQMLVRDSTLQEVTYMGTKYLADGTAVAGMHETASEPCCANGWRVISMTAHGVFCEPPKPLDGCFDGLPLVMGRRYPRTDRLWCAGELDHIIPMQREINRRRKNLSRALELSANPPVITNKDSGLLPNINTVEAGEILKVTRGSELKWMEYRGPSEFQFQMLGIDQRDVDTISGVHDVQQGQRPAGIEAAAAIRRLQEAAQVRVRGMEAVAHRERAALLRKLLYCAGRKLAPQISFRGAGGQVLNVNADDLCQQYDIQFARGTGTVAGRQDMEDKALALFDRHALDRQGLLEALNWKGREEIVARMTQQDIAMAVAQARAGAAAGGHSNGSGPPKRGGRIPQEAA